MLSYRSRGLRIAEVWFDESDRDIDADIVRYVWALTPPIGAACTSLCTLVVDLGRTEDELLGSMKKETRRQIRHASQKDSVACGASNAPVPDLLLRFRSAYDMFARQRKRLPLPWQRVERLVAANRFELSWAAFHGGGELVFHSYAVVGNRARLLHSVSTPGPAGDPAARNLVGRSNRLLHWNDIVRFKARGVATYDLGGWYAGSTDTKKLQINAFKEEFGGHVEKDYNAERLLTTKARVAVFVANLLGTRG